MDAEARKVLKALDFHPQIKCDAKHCNNLATHVVRMKCGHDAATLCVVHANALVNHYLLAAALGQVGRCHIDNQPASFDAQRITV